MDMATGEIIFEKNKDEQVAVASMTKMVAQIIILEQIEAGKIKWTDIVTARLMPQVWEKSNLFNNRRRNDCRRYDERHFHGKC